MSIYYGTSFGSSQSILNDDSKKIEFSFRRTADLHPLQPRCRLRRATVAGDIVDVYEFIQNSTNYRLTAGGDLVSGVGETFYLVSSYNGSQNFLHGTQSDTAKQGLVTLNSSNGWPSVKFPDTGGVINYGNILSKPITKMTMIFRAKPRGASYDLYGFRKSDDGSNEVSFCLGGAENYFSAGANVIFLDNNTLRPTANYSISAVIYNGEEASNEDRFKWYLNNVKSSLDASINTAPTSINYEGSLNFPQWLTYISDAYYTDWILYDRVLTEEELTTVYNALAGAY